MKGKIIKDWNKIDLTSKVDLKKFAGAFQYFMTAPDKDKVLKSAIQAFTTKGDFPAEIMTVLEKYHATPDFDLGYESLFDIRDFTGTNQSGFDILDVESGLTFAKVKTGDKARVFGMSGSKTSVTFDRYGGGLMWDRTLIDDKQYWTLEDNAIAFRNKAYSTRAAAFYALIEALPDDSDHNVAWAAAPGSVPNTNENYIPLRDAATIEAAIIEILVALKDSGLGVNANSPFKILAPIQLRNRIETALKLLQQPVAGSSKKILFNVQPMYTLMLESSSVYYVVLPKAKMKGGYRMDLTLFNMFQILEYADMVAGWMRYGGAIGETDQLRRCAIS